jgi:hypothetical protein
VFSTAPAISKTIDRTLAHFQGRFNGFLPSHPEQKGYSRAEQALTEVPLGSIFKLVIQTTSFVEPLSITSPLWENGIQGLFYCPPGH